MNDFEKAINEHKQRIDQQIHDQIEKGIADGSIVESEFEMADNGDKCFRLNDQQGTEIIYNFTKKKVHSYGGNLNQG